MEQYAKTPLTFDEQADLLSSRGIVGSRSLIRDRLSSVNYYRLSGYLYPYREADGSNDFRIGTTFETVWNHYAFDRRLRLLLLDAIERIEIALKTQFAYHHAHSNAQSPFAYTDCSIFREESGNRHADLLERLGKEIGRKSKHIIVRHFREKYGQGDLPIWMAVEFMSFGTLQRFYRGADQRGVQAPLASYFHIPVPVLRSWLHVLNVIRNQCAHHERVWNCVLDVKPFIPRKPEYPDWHSPTAIQNDRIFSILTICQYCLSIIAPQSHWRERLLSLLNDYPVVNPRHMGFPDNWRESPLWHAPPTPNP